MNELEFGGVVLFLFFFPFCFLGVSLASRSLDAGKMTDRKRNEGEKERRRADFNIAVRPYAHKHTTKKTSVLLRAQMERKGKGKGSLKNFLLLGRWVAWFINVGKKKHWDFGHIQKGYNAVSLIRRSFQLIFLFFSFIYSLPWSEFNEENNKKKGILVDVL